MSPAAVSAESERPKSGKSKDKKMKALSSESAADVEMADATTQPKKEKKDKKDKKAKEDGDGKKDKKKNKRKSAEAGDETTDKGKEHKKELREKKEKATVEDGEATAAGETEAEAMEIDEEAPKAEKKKAKKSKRVEKEATTEDAGASPSKKRKRETLPSELEIDVTLPEPPSKKALRLIKKGKLSAPAPTPAADSSAAPASSADAKPIPEHSSQNRSKFGIWIGNLSFQTTKADLSKFLITEGSIPESNITRVNLPTNANTGRNKGFAYIDFTAASDVPKALELSELNLQGRNVLIKDARDFNKPKEVDAKAKAGGANMSKNPPSNILYVGNLDFEVKEEELKEHFAFAGSIVRVRLMRFQDSGKCKGFGFVDFEDVESVTRAMKGLTEEEESTLGSAEGKEEFEIERRRKKRALVGSRKVTMEYGEDQKVRYKKRYGGKKEEGDGAQKEAFVEVERPRFNDRREAAKGAAYSSDPSRTGAMVKNSGKKMTFDE